MKENGERRKQRRNCCPPSIAKSEVIDRFVQTEAYICLEPREITKKKTETKSYYKDKMGRNKKLQQKQQKREMRVNSAEM